MPNWKSYDSSVRLLSAILAAHPELKLNYQGRYIHLHFSSSRLDFYHDEISLRFESCVCV
jgi:hypothetical protein